MRINSICRLDLVHFRRDWPNWRVGCHRERRPVMRISSDVSQLPARVLVD